MCKNTIYWPNTLFQLNYKIQLIEQTINLESSQKINPDIVAVSKKLSHAIIADCKSGDNIDKNQNARYKELKSDDLVYVTIPDKNQLSHNVCYVVNDQNYPKLEPHTEFPFIVFSQNDVKLQGKFNLKEVDQKLCDSIKLENNREPTGYYPFSPEDKNYVIMPHVLRGLISFYMNKSKKQHTINNPPIEEEILKIIHPYDLISTRHKGNLTQKIKTMIMFMKKNREFREQISKIENNNDNTSTMQNLKKICEQLIAKHEKQKQITDKF